MGAYDDIINLPHPTSAKHPRMPMIDRAAQFSPFQALSGYGAAISETARITDQKAELTEEEKDILNEKLLLLLDSGNKADFIYFQPDARKSGGSYVTVRGILKKIDPVKQCAVLADGTAISLENIVQIEASLGQLDM